MRVERPQRRRDAATAHWQSVDDEQWLRLAVRLPGGWIGERRIATNSERNVAIRGSHDLETGNAPGKHRADVVGLLLIRHVPRDRRRCAGLAGTTLRAGRRCWGARRRAITSL